jgi:hypothetical protein
MVFYFVDFVLETLVELEESYSELMKVQKEVFVSLTIGMKTSGRWLALC